MLEISNNAIASQLRQMADLLLHQGDRTPRPSAYRRAAEVIDGLNVELKDVLREQGFKGLVALPAIGHGIAGAIAEIFATGRWAQLDRLTGAMDPEAMFRSIPGIGGQLAQRLHEGLGIDTLRELQLAAHDGRLANLPGMGPQRVTEIRLALKDLLGDPIGAGAPDQPSVELLLEIDALYRRSAVAGVLRMIAPRRFNPGGAPRLPVLHAERKGWRFTVLFSNTARAHKLHKTNDWVIIYAQSEAGPELRFTVVSESQGPLERRRVVRGRERECIEHYQHAEIDA